MFMENISNKFNVGDVITTSDGRVGRIVDVESSIDIFTNNYIYRYKVLFDHLEPLWFNEDDLKKVGRESEEFYEPLNNAVQNNTTRTCYYLGEKATFHRWVDETKMLLKFNSIMSDENIKKVADSFLQNAIIPEYADTVPLITTFALIELKDGSVKKVPPEEIRFVDKR